MESAASLEQLLAQDAALAPLFESLVGPTADEFLDGPVLLPSLPLLASLQTWREHSAMMARRAREHGPREKQQKWARSRAGRPHSIPLAPLSDGQPAIVGRRPTEEATMAANRMLPTAASSPTIMTAATAGPRPWCGAHGMTNSKTQSPASLDEDEQCILRQSVLRTVLRRWRARTPPIMAPEAPLPLPQRQQQLARAFSAIRRCASVQRAASELSFLSVALASTLKCRRAFPAWHRWAEASRLSSTAREYHLDAVRLVALRALWREAAVASAAAAAKVANAAPAPHEPLDDDARQLHPPPPPLHGAAEGALPPPPPAAAAAVASSPSSLLAALLASPASVAVSTSPAAAASPGSPSTSPPPAASSAASIPPASPFTLAAEAARAAFLRPPEPPPRWSRTLPADGLPPPPDSAVPSEGPAQKSHDTMATTSPLETSPPPPEWLSLIVPSLPAPAPGPAVPVPPAPAPPRASSPDVSEPSSPDATAASSPDAPPPPPPPPPPRQGVPMPSVLRDALLDSKVERMLEMGHASRRLFFGRWRRLCKARAALAWQGFAFGERSGLARALRRWLASVATLLRAAAHALLSHDLASRHRVRRACEAWRRMDASARAHRRVTLFFLQVRLSLCWRRWQSARRERERRRHPMGIARGVEALRKRGRLQLAFCHRWHARLPQPPPAVRRAAQLAIDTRLLRAALATWEVWTDVEMAFRRPVPRLLGLRCGGVLQSWREWAANRRGVLVRVSDARVASEWRQLRVRAREWRELACAASLRALALRLGRAKALAHGLACWQAAAAEWSIARHAFEAAEGTARRCVWSRWCAAVARRRLARASLDALLAAAAALCRRRLLQGGVARFAAAAFARQRALKLRARAGRWHTAHQMARGWDDLVAASTELAECCTALRLAAHYAGHRAQLGAFTGLRLRARRGGELERARRRSRSKCLFRALARLHAHAAVHVAVSASADATRRRARAAAFGRLSERTRGPSAAVGRWCAPRERAEAFGAAPLAPLDEPRRLRAARRGRAGPQRDAPSAGALGVLCRGSRAAGRRRGAWAARAARVRLGRAEGPAEAAGGAAQRDTCARACASD